MSTKEFQGNPYKRLKFTRGEPLRAFIRAAHHAMFAADPDKHSVESDGSMPATSQAVIDGTNFGLSLAKAQNPHYQTVKPALDFDEQDRLISAVIDGYIIFDGPVYTPENSILEYAPLAIRRLIDSYNNLRDDIRMLDSLDSVYNFMNTDVAACARASDDSIFKMKYAANMANMKYLQAIIAKNSMIEGLPAGASLSSVSAHLLERDLKQVLEFVEDDKVEGAEG